MKNPKNGRDFNHSQLEGIPIAMPQGLPHQNPNVDPQQVRAEIRSATNARSPAKN